MTPEDVLLEAMSAVAAKGNSSELRERMCRKLEKTLTATEEAARYGYEIEVEDCIVQDST